MTEQGEEQDTNLSKQQVKETRQAIKDKNKEHKKEHKDKVQEKGDNQQESKSRGTSWLSAMPFTDLVSGFKSFLTGVTKLDDIHENEDSYTANFSVAGYSKDQITVYVEGQQLIIEGIKDKEAAENAKKQQEGQVEVKDQSEDDQAQQSTGSNKNFKWTYPVPMDVDQSNISGEVKDGLLYLTLKKKKQNQGARKDVSIS